MKSERTILFIAALPLLWGFVVGDLARRSDDNSTDQTPAGARGSQVSDCRPAKEIQTYDIIERFNRIRYRGYLIETRHRMEKLSVPREYGPPPKPVKVSYAIVTRRGKTIAKFDSGIFFPLGNSTAAGLFDLVNNGTKQLIVSQDIPKTGVQWVADFSRNSKIIFDGQKFQVGREGNDMTISDLDGDEVQEITVPITAFYGFQNWRLTTSDTPLPTIVFKYDAATREYLPANPLFKKCLLKNIEAEEEHARSVNQQFQLGSLISVVLDYVFAGDETRGWQFFDETCKLPDKAQIKADIKKELETHPVYRYLKRAAPRERKSGVLG